VPQVSSGTHTYCAGSQEHKIFNVYFLRHLKETEQYRVYVLYVLCKIRTDSLYKRGNTNGVISIESVAMEKQYGHPFALLRYM
jgi:hypothetical protein